MYKGANCACSAPSSKALKERGDQTRGMLLWDAAFAGLIAISLGKPGNSQACRPPVEGFESSSSKRDRLRGSLRRPVAYLRQARVLTLALLFRTRLIPQTVPH